MLKTKNWYASCYLYNQDEKSKPSDEKVSREEAYEWPFIWDG